MQTIDVLALRKMMDAGEDIFLVDVREAWEHELYNIGQVLMPLSNLFQGVESLPKDRPIIVYCEKGIRSMIAIQRLANKHGFTNLINLSGGMQAWKALQ